MRHERGNDFFFPEGARHAHDSWWDGPLHAVLLVLLLVLLVGGIVWLLRRLSPNVAQAASTCRRRSSGRRASRRSGGLDTADALCERRDLPRRLPGRVRRSDRSGDRDRSMARRGCSAGRGVSRHARSVYGRNSVNPAAAKSPSKASASLTRFFRMTAKLVASTNEYGRSSWTRSHAQASASSSESIGSTVKATPTEH